MQKLDDRPTRDEFMYSKAHVAPSDRLREYVELVTQEPVIDILGFRFYKIGLTVDGCHTGYNVAYNNPDINLTYSDYLKIHIRGWRASSCDKKYHGSGETPEIAILEMQKSVTENVRHAEKKVEEAVALLKEARANERKYGPRIFK
jgi:hypothetical protein